MCRLTEGARDPWYIFANQGEPLVMAAIWQDWTGPDGQALRSCALVTAAANAAMRKIHQRMPVILKKQDWPLWPGEAGSGASRLMRAAPEDALEYHRVDRAVNSNKASGPDLISEITKP